MKNDSEDIVELAKVPTAQEAHMLAQALEDEGIPARVVGDFLDAGMGSLNAVPAEVWVKQTDLEKARALYTAYENARQARADEDE
jgi:hypothetical protein